ncbi:MAG: LysM peptidoglycan-binding domain-containing protein [Sphingomonadales bacterium]|nr:MAG: LysM peptidoglycan-binding domain-containing protein [Sphingomonadales bacterium]
MQSRGGVSAFEIYLRTGHRLQAGVEVKFNPWHDPENGRFTFAGSGRYFPGGQTRSGPVQSIEGQIPRQPGASGSVGLATQSDPVEPDHRRFDPKSSRNHSIYTVQRGDTLTRIAGQRRGLTASGLAWLNERPLDRPLRIGERIRIPHQRVLEEGRESWNRYLALGYYARTHGGRSPPNPANPPSLESQILDSNWRRESRNGYDFQIDLIGRPRKIYGLLSVTVSPMRSRRSQGQAGGGDRRGSDDGGHYIAARFNGPRESFNHFAQNANFNRGSYRVLEDRWAKDLREGRKVFVDIVPHYAGTSRRPDRVDVTWYIDGEKHKAKFSNEATGRADGRP